jgi:glycosyltransferase involved in cell wall biosynthesis
VCCAPQLAGIDVPFQPEQPQHSLRIAQVAPLAESVPPKLYGGTERIVSWLTEELVALGHDVTLFAAGDSVTDATLISACSHSLRAGGNSDLYVSYAILLESITRLATKFDVIHCHTDWLHLPLLRRLGIPCVTTLHGRLDHLGATAVSLLDAPFISVSNSQRAPCPDLAWVGTVHHGMPLNLLQPCFAPDAYVAFLGRIAPEKGPETAVRWARAAQRPLRMAAKVPRGNRLYFQSTIAPLLADDVTFVGEIGDGEKQSFLGKAAALLFPVDWPEPFGLVMIEAMACGTPVIAKRRGSVCEIIEDGVTGFIVDSEDAAVAAIRGLHTIDRRRVRAEFERRFTVGRMTRDYVRLYRELVMRSGPVTAPAGMPADIRDRRHDTRAKEPGNCAVARAGMPRGRASD